jgi:protein O-mannosyl-transferase
MSKKSRRPLRPAQRAAPSRGRPRLTSGLVVCGLAGLTLAAYANSFGTGFPLDSRALILQDPRVHALSRQNLALILQHTYWWPYGESGLYRPITTLSYLFNYAILGNAQQTAGYHWLNLLLHAANVVLVYLLGRRLVGRTWPAAFIAAVWAVHPVLTEAVTNIVGRADLLAAFAVLSGLLMYLRSTEAEGWRRLAWLAGLMAVATLGVFSKESAVVLPGVIVLYELAWWSERGPLRGLLTGCAVLVAPLAALAYQRSVVLSAAVPAVFPFTDNPLVGAGFWTARLTAIGVMARSLGLIIWPATLSCDYSYAQIPFARGTVTDWIGWMAIAAAFAAIGLLFWRRRRAAFFAAAFAVLTYLPASNLLFMSGTIMAERLLYLPSIGVIACLVMAVHAAGVRVRWTPTAPVALALVAAAFMVRTWIRNPDWSDELALASSAVRTSPDSFKSHEMLAEALYDADPTQANLGRVIDEAEKSVAIVGRLPDAENDPEIFRRTAGYYLDQGDHIWRGRTDAGPPPPESLALYRRSVPLLERAQSILIAVTPGLDRPGQHRGGASAELATVDRLLSAADLRLGDSDAALDAALRARESNVGDPQTHLQLASVLLSKGERDAAAVALTAGLMSTANADVERKLFDLYRGGLDPEHCALVQGPAGPTLNTQCPVVHEEMCSAATDLVDLHRRGGRPDVADQIGARARSQYGCTPGRLPRE